ncbi:MAG TPA: VanW family protein [Candidatus Limnocylindrales bacterium]|nr:VanW family protein [Candidatus Limnocylindrales bacterium]
MTSAALPRRFLRPAFTPPNLRAALIGFLATLVAGLLLIGGLSTALGLTTGPAALPNVSVGGVSLAGLDRATAEQRLIGQLPSLGTGAATIAVDGEEFVVPYADVGRGYEMDAMLDRAFAVGRTGSPLADGVARVRAMIHPTAVPVLVHAFDPPAFEAAVAEVAREARIPATEAAVVRSGTTFEVRPSAEGRALDPEALRTSLAAALATTDPADVRIELAPVRLSPRVDTATATAAAEAARATVVGLELTVPGAAEGEEPIELTASTISGWIGFGPAEGSVYTVTVDERAAAAAVAELVERVDRNPVNARITVAGSGLGGVVPGQTGRVLDVDASTSALLATLADRGRGTPSASLALAVDETDPELTTAEAEEALPQMRLVSSWTTNYVVNDGNGFGANISIPAWDLDGYNLAPGEWFSFWGGIGPVTVERGYQYGGAIINGRSVANGALAGGICSTSTTLFNAAMRFGLEIGDRTAHYYYIDRYPTGLDATVAIVDTSVVDMTFRNDTEHPIVIRGFGTPGQVTFQLWSVPNGRTVVLSDPVITDRRAAIETTQVDTSLAPGTSRRVEYPHHGFNATVHRTVYGPDGGVIHQNTWFSAYRAVNGITLVGPTAAAPPPDDPPADDGATAGTGDAPADPPPGDDEG